jgi:hypothetical protein
MVCAGLTEMRDNREGVLSVQPLRMSKAIGQQNRIHPMEE